MTRRDRLRIHLVPKQLGSKLYYNIFDDSYLGCIQLYISTDGPIPKNVVSVSESASDTDSDTNSCPKSCPFISADGQSVLLKIPEISDHNHIRISR